MHVGKIIVGAIIAVGLVIVGVAGRLLKRNKYSKLNGESIY